MYMLTFSNHVIDGILIIVDKRDLLSHELGIDGD